MSGKKLKSVSVPSSSSSPTVDDDAVPPPPIVASFDDAVGQYKEIFSANSDWKKFLESRKTSTKQPAVIAASSVTEQDFPVVSLEKVDLDHENFSPYPRIGDIEFKRAILCAAGAQAMRCFKHTCDANTKIMQWAQVESMRQRARKTRSDGEQPQIELAPGADSICPPVNLSPVYLPSRDSVIFGNCLLFKSDKAESGLLKAGQGEINYRKKYPEAEPDKKTDKDYGKYRQVPWFSACIGHELVLWKAGYVEVFLATCASTKPSTTTTTTTTTTLSPVEYCSAIDRALNEHSSKDSSEKHALYADAYPLFYNRAFSEILTDYATSACLTALSILQTAGYLFYKVVSLSERDYAECLSGEYTSKNRVYDFPFTPAALVVTVNSTPATLSRAEYLKTIRKLVFAGDDDSRIPATAIIAACDDNNASQAMIEEGKRPSAVRTPLVEIINKQGCCVPLEFDDMDAQQFDLVTKSSDDEDFADVETLKECVRCLIIEVMETCARSSLLVMQQHSAAVDDFVKSMAKQEATRT